MTPFERKLEEERERYERCKKGFIPDPNVPLITPFTRYLDIPDRVLDKLWRIRQHDPEDGPIPVDIGPLWRTEYALKNYQTAMVAHLALMPKFINGDAVGLGKTIETIAAICYLKKRNPKLKILVATTKSTVFQWAEEIARFSKLNVVVMPDSYKKKSGFPARLQYMQDFFTDISTDVLVCKYTTMIGVRREVEGGFDADGNPVEDNKEKISQETKAFCKAMGTYKDELLIVCDEAHRFKTEGSSMRKLVVNMSRRSDRAWALTATAIKNNLVEFYSIANAIGVRPFGTIYNFKEDYCRMVLKRAGHGRKWEVVGYRNIPRFKTWIRPFYLGRSQKQVKEPLPRLASQPVPVELSKYQTKILLEDLPNGTLWLPPSIKKVAGEMVEAERDLTNMMTMLAVNQLVANHPCLLDREDKASFFTPKLSSKEEAMLDLLDGKLAGEKVIVFTKFRTWIDRLEHLTKEGKFTERKFLRITGSENEKKRALNRRLFQESDEHDLIFINTAGIEGINLQQAAHMISGDLPWGFGDVLQLIGRMVRMASPHSACTLWTLIAKGTIDEYVIETLRSKKGLFEAIFGVSHSIGVLDSGNLDVDISASLDTIDEKPGQFLHLLEAHIKTTSMKKYLDGSILAEEKAGDRESWVGDKMSGKKVKKKVSEMSIKELSERWKQPGSKADIIE